jgi:hypothetical protein
VTTVKRPGLRSVLTRAGYRRLFAAQTISRWGDTVNTVALVVLVYRLTGSGLGVSGAVIAEIVPVLLLAPVAGAVTEEELVAANSGLWSAAVVSQLALAPLGGVLVGHLGCGPGVLAQRCHLPLFRRVPVDARPPVLTKLIGLSRGRDRLGNMHPETGNACEKPCGSSLRPTGTRRPSPSWPAMRAGTAWTRTTR